jgi:hypothetical protein
MNPARRKKLYRLELAEQQKTEILTVKEKIEEKIEEKKPQVEEIKPEPPVITEVNETVVTKKKKVVNEPV